MKSHYNIILFDGSFFLYRNQAVYRDATPSKLASSFMQSVVKLVRESNITFDVGFLAFDKGPYYRTQILKGEYKDSRDKFTQDEINEAKEVADNAFGEDKAKLQARYEYMRSNFDKMVTRESAMDILSCLGDFGLTTLRYKGYEADDLARIICDLYSDKYSILLLSIDSDWIGNVRPNVDYLRVRHRGIKDLYTKDTVKDYPYYIEMRDEGLEEMGLDWYLEILESMGVGHNDMRKCFDPNKPITIGEIVASWDDLEKLRESHNFDVDTFKRQVKTFKYKEFPDYGWVVSDILSHKYNLKSPKEFNETLLYNFGVTYPFNKYKSLYESIRNYSLLQLF